MQTKTSPLHTRSFSDGALKMHMMTADATQDNLKEACDVASRQAAALKGQLVFQYLFGGRRYQQQALDAMPPLNGPLTLLQGDTCRGDTITGSQWMALSGVELHPIRDGDRLVGNWYETDHARYCLLGDLRADDLTASREEQTLAVFNKMATLLKQAEMAFTDIIRTWFYLNQLLEWYDAFNRIRTQFFTEQGTFEKRVPASTGIGAGTAAGEEVVCALLAIKPKTDQIHITTLPSPLQCPALDYKSSFARAVEVEVPDSRLLMISGTASIDPNGKTVHADNTGRQIELSMAVVHALLKSRNMDWEQTVRAIAYFKHAADIQLFKTYCARNQLPELPVAISHADICRDDLLFEIELDAVSVH
jgi:enamine deaminase RidA (YjgF/YER057c/UK114 family)